MEIDRYYLEQVLSVQVEKRDQFVVQANLEVAALNGRIAQLKELINEFKTKEVDTTNGDLNRTSVVAIPATETEPS